MFGRSKNGAVAEAAGAVAEAAGAVAQVGSRLVEDRKIRERTLAAVNAAVAAKRRAKRQAGFIGAARRLAEDEVLREQLLEAFAQLKEVQALAGRRRGGHKLRNTFFVLAGFGAVSAAVTAPPVRDAVLSFVRRARESAGIGLSRMITITEEIEVDVALQTAYNQWTQFEQFPQFMSGIDEVRQLDDTHLHWSATIAGRHAEWDAKILQQKPDELITWQSTDGKHTRGTVAFTDAGPGRTRIRLAMMYAPEGAAEQLGSAAGLDAKRIRGDLEKFKQLIESQGFESGAWRGEVDGGVKTKSSS
jgi:uncharacterized membrane protein